MTNLADTALDPRRAALRRQEARTKAWRAAIVVAFFALLIGANLYVGAVMLVGTLQSRSDDAQTALAARTGRVSRSLLDGTFCRSVSYDNELAHITADKIVPCDDISPRRRGRNSFNWGKE
ncbi:MAG: hypothetical protein ACK4UO_15505 [Pseudolabrys sp.]